MHVIGTAGHVDHGKSALVERLTGIDPDRFAEEKRRGLTIDLGFAWLALPSGNEVGIIDVPGHERFIRNMLAGAGGITVCLFVVAANEGWKPQSSEHLAIVDILGIGAGIVALTKSDTVTDDEIERVTASIHDHVHGTVLEGAPVIACSAVTGAGLDELVTALDDLVTRTPPAEDRGRPRLWVDRVFTIAGAGTVVTGTLAGGSFSVGDAIEISPEGRRARIRTIQSHKKEVEVIGPGNRTALNLAGLERQGAERGDAIVRSQQWRPTRTIDVRLRVLPESIAPRTHALTEKGSHLLYVGSAETPVRVKLLEGGPVGPGNEAYVQLQLRDVLPLARGDRFVLRDAGRILTFGGGEVLDPLPLVVTGDRTARTSLLGRLDGDDAAALGALVDAHGTLDVNEARLRVPVDPGKVERIRQLGGVLVSERRFTELVDSVRDVLARHHSDHPLEPGMPREALRAALDRGLERARPRESQRAGLGRGLESAMGREAVPGTIRNGLDADAFDALVVTIDDVISEGAFLRLNSHAVTLSPDEQAARDRVVAAIQAGEFSPPPAGELGADRTLLRALVDSGDIVAIGDFYLTAELAAEARAKVRAYIEEKGPVTVAQIRDLLATSRKYAVPLCEWLDDTGATLRRGDLRHLGPTP